MSLERLMEYVIYTLTIAVPLCTVMGLWRISYLRKNNHKPTFKDEVPKWMFIFYMFSLYIITVFRADFNLQHILTRPAELQKVNSIPLVEMLKLLDYGYIWSFTYNFIGNIFWFLPYGFLLPMVSNKKISWMKVILKGALISFSIEVLQFIFVTGIADVDDIIFNTIGTIIGLIAYKMLRDVHYKLNDRK